MLLTLNVVGGDNGLKPRGERTPPTAKQPWWQRVRYDPAGT